MGNGMLDEIMALEKEIEEAVAAERKRVAAWLAQVREEAERRYEEEERDVRQARAGAESRARALAEKDLAAALDEARALAARLAALDDDTLRAIVRRHIGAILPGEQHDHQDVQD